jgi:hypothetical protein
MEAIWRFLGDKRNRVILSWLGGGAVVVIGGLWAAFVFFAGDSDKIKARVDELIFALGNAGTPRMFVSLQALAGPSHSPVADTSARRSAPIMQSADVIACALAMHAPS